jgi:hypothetical protein
MYCLSALAGGTMFCMWWRTGQEGRRRVWRLYGWFTALMLVGSCSGIATWLTWMQRLTYLFSSLKVDPEAEKTFLRALGFRWRAAFTVMYPIQFACLSVTKLMVLDRLSEFVRLQSGSNVGRWIIAGRVVMLVVVSGNIVGLACNITAAIFFHRASDFLFEASVYFAGNNSVRGKTYADLAVDSTTRSNFFTSVQSWCEVFVLLLILLAFVGAAVTCARIIGAALTINAGDKAVSAGRQLRLQIMGTVGCIFVAFVLRSAFSTMCVCRLPPALF